MAEEQVVLSASAGGIATITLHRPDTLNAINRAMCDALNIALVQAAEDSAIAVVILTGSGRAFSSGADLNEGLTHDESVTERLNRGFLPGLKSIIEMPKPVIAAINGPALGIGSAYPLAADLAVMAETAFLQQPFVNIGLIPDGGVTWQLLHRLGHKRAFEQIALATEVSAAECSQLGLVNQVCPAEQVMTQAQQWAQRLLKAAPLALRYSKRALRLNFDVSFEHAFANEVELQQLCGDSEDFQEGVAAFRAKRPARFRGL